MRLAPQLLPVEPSLDGEYYAVREAPRARRRPHRIRRLADDQRLIAGDEVGGRETTAERRRQLLGVQAQRRHLLKSPSREPRPRRLVLAEYAIGDRRHARHVVDAAHALARTPDVAP